MSEFLTIADVLALHEILIARYGGAEGVRDMGALEAALFRPQSGYYDDVIQEAAALWESLSQNHPFIDGNKRVAFAAMDVFLRMNQVRITASSKAIETFIFGLFGTQSFDYHHLEAWLRAHTTSA